MWTRWLLPFWGAARRDPHVGSKARLLRMLDALLRVLIGATIIWWLVTRR